jgi:hypothetical protein
MMNRQRGFLRLQTVAAVILMVAFALTGRIEAQPGVQVVMSGLDNPRGMAFGPEGALYIAEAGRGGDGPCQVIVPPDGPACFGLTGAVSRLWNGVQTRVISGLPSTATATGQANGPNDISLLGRGGAFVAIGSGGHPSLRANWGPDGELMGTLLQVSASGEWRVVRDVAGYELSNPDGGLIDSNAFGVLALPGEHLVTDAGGNSLVSVKANGDPSTVAVFPARASGRPTDAVPTDVVVGPDGAFYVSELSGVPFADGAANIYRVVPGQAPTVYAGGFKTAIDLDFGPDGSLYVLEHATGPVFFTGLGRIVRVAPNGARSVVVSGLTRPTSLLVTGEGLFVTNNGISVGIGQVLFIPH